jgi:hypothetical protein
VLNQYNTDKHEKLKGKETNITHVKQKEKTANKTPIHM